MVKINVNIEADNAAEYRETLRKLLSDSEISGQTIHTITGINVTAMPSAEKLHDALSKIAEPEKQSRKKPDPVPPTEPESIEEPTPEPAHDEQQPEIKPEDLRSRVRAIVDGGVPQASIVPVLKKYGCTSLKALPKEKYAEFLETVEALEA
ncbi:MAG: hypothetical protein H6Q67_2335 [Firmicutes bacterium]|nr:hypothetical protein [Bacillota bacterium]